MKDNKDNIQIGEKITVFFKNVDEKKRINVYQINKDIEPVRKEFHDKKRLPRKDLKKQNSENNNQKNKSIN